MPYFHHDGVDFFYRDTLAGLPVIFQHGLGADVSQPFELFQPPSGFRLIAFDVRSHGHTHPATRPEELGFNLFADDLRALLDCLGIDQAVVGGTSLGAGIALNFALRWPRRVLGLILSRPAWLDRPCPWNVQMFSLITRALREHGPLRGRTHFQQTPEYRQTLAEWPMVAESMLRQFEHPQAEETADKYERIVQDCPNHDPNEWARIAVPTLVLANRQDPVHPFEYGERLAKSIPRAELREITSKSRSIKEHNADVQRELETFLTRHFSQTTPGPV